MARTKGAPFMTPVQGTQTVPAPWVIINKKAWYFETAEDTEAFAKAASKVKCISPMVNGHKIHSPRNGG